MSRTTRKHKTASERRAASEARRLAAGGRNVRVVLGPAGSMALTELRDSGMTSTAAIEEGLIRLAEARRRA